ncbi:nuclear transport factor 2 family protein [Ktedonosporobacter rubrisoli]|uniref:Nuclear transport factor 2 family protein n=1 Tax=Ktedonosporobacter rubrisoli TaxID=2509675 RepID=A0A4P6JUZ6_KTERU|nr:nuclear transport factor 2 family protein [Ktedonosporobacter rubrisoli]QBD79142.1 nuclear transport factor 2 family protein [Ktedonosporobacter rubrisoli]
MSKTFAADMDALRQAIEQRNAALLIDLYADNAQMQIVDRLHQPSSPLELRGKQAIADFLNDIFNRDMTHRVMDEVVGTNRLSFNQACQYASGERVLAASVLDLQNGKIVRETTVQAWDE